METYRHPHIAAVSPQGGYTDLRSTPFSVGTYKVILDTQFHPPGNGVGVFAFTNRWTLTETLFNVKYLRLLWATFPHVADPGDGSGSDEMITIRSASGAAAASKQTIPTGSFVSAFPPKSATVGTSTQFIDSHLGAVACLQNTAFPGAATLHYQALDYDIVQYFNTPITQISDISLQFFNSIGLPIGYGEGQNPNKVVMCWEFTCAGVGSNP